MLKLQRKIDFESGYSIKHGLDHMGDDDNVLWLSRGRDALALICRQLQGKHKTPEILIPAFICDIVPQTLVNNGITVAFYDVGPRLELDISLVKKGISKSTVAILYVNYFGFPQKVDRVQAVCDLGFPVIEDNTQASLSASVLATVSGKKGWIITSYRKILSVPDGATLRTCGDISPIVVSSLCTPSVIHIACRTLGLLFKGISISFPFHYIESATQECFTGAERSRNYETPARSSTVSKKLFKMAPIKKIIDRRRSNAGYLMERITDGEVAVADMPEGVCPFGLAVFVKKRAGVINRLKDNKVIAAVLWEHLPVKNPDEYPNAVSISNKIVVLPVGQGYGLNDMKRIIAVINHADEEKGNNNN